MSMLSVRVGTRVRTIFTATNLETGQLDDPGVVVLSIERPDESIEQIFLNTGIVHDALGVFHYDITTDQEGGWTCSWAGSGSGPNVVETNVFEVIGTGLVDPSP